MESTAILRERRLRTVPFLGIFVHEKVGCPGSAKLRSVHSVHRCAPTEMVRDKQDILIPATRGVKGTEIIEQDRFALSIK